MLDFGFLLWGICSSSNQLESLREKGQFSGADHVFTLRKTTYGVDPQMLQVEAVCTRIANRLGSQELKMAKVTEVRRVMVDVVVDELDYITDDVITARVAAVEIDPSHAVMPGNRLVSDGKVWTWEDTPDNVCGHTRIWSHVKKAGDS